MRFSRPTTRAGPMLHPSDLYIAITTARMIGIGAMTIAERKYAQHGAPAYMYVFKHESGAHSGTQHKTGTPHATEIRTSSTMCGPGAERNAARKVAMPGGGVMAVSRPESVKAAHNMAEMWSTFAERAIRPPRVSRNGPPTPANARHHGNRRRMQGRERPVPLERNLWERLDP